jgi:plastocyanin
MRKQLFRSIFICGLSAIGIMVGNQKPALAADDVTVKIVLNGNGDFVFDPTDVPNKKGHSITIVWDAIDQNVTHHLAPGIKNNATPTEMDKTFNDTGEFKKSKTQTFTSTPTGVIHYHCIIHGTMKGTITTVE